MRSSTCLLLGNELGEIVSYDISSGAETKVTLEQIHASSLSALVSSVHIVISAAADAVNVWRWDEDGLLRLQIQLDPEGIVIDLACCVLGTEVKKSLVIDLLESVS